MIRADLWASVNAGWNLIEFKSVKLRIKLRNMHGIFTGKNAHKEIILRIKSDFTTRCSDMMYRVAQFDANVDINELADKRTDLGI